MRRLFVSAFAFIAAVFVSVAPASAQTCQGAFGEAVYIAGLELPNAQPGRYDPAFPSLCSPQDYARMQRYFPGYGLLQWLPMAGVPFGGVWGRGGQPYLNGYGQPLGPTGKGALIGGTLGAGIGVAKAGAKGGFVGVLIGAAGGAIVGLVVERRHPQRSTQASVQQLPVEAPVAQPYPPDYNPARDGRVAQDVPRFQTQGQLFKVVNPTKLTVYIWDQANPDQVYTIGPGRTEKVARPDGELSGSAWKTNASGGVEPIEVSIVGDGVKFLVVLKGE